MKSTNLLKLVVCTGWLLLALAGQPVAAQAQASPPGTGKTLSAALLGSQMQANGDPEYKYVSIRR